MYVVTDSDTGENHIVETGSQALWDSINLNTKYDETIRGAIVTALHWIEYQEDN